MIHNQESYARLSLIVILSLGRSGSTFFAKALTENSDFFNSGENRYFWERLMQLPPERHPEEVGKYFSRLSGGNVQIVDKTPDLYRCIESVNFGDHDVRIIQLCRANAAIERSRANFAATLRRPKRLILRMKQYRRKYGWRWLVPILQRWYFVPALLGFERERLFATNAGRVKLEDEREAFEAVIARLRAHAPVVTVDYDDFPLSVGSLKEYEFSYGQIEAIRASFRG